MKNIKNFIWESFNDAELMTQDLYQNNVIYSEIYRANCNERYS